MEIFLVNAERILNAIEFSILSAVYAAKFKYLIESVAWFNWGVVTRP